MESRPAGVELTRSLTPLVELPDERALPRPDRVPPPRPAAGGLGPSDLRRYGLILRAHWRLIVGVFGLVVTAVAVGTYLQSPTYRAVGLIEFRRQDAEVTPMDALFQSERLTRQYLETQYAVLRSPVLARAVIAGAGLATTPEFREAAESPLPGGARPDGPTVLRRLVPLFAQRLVVDPVSGSNVARVYFESADPRLAARVVNAVIDTYIGMRVEAAREAVVRVGAQVDSTRGRLAAAERELQDYARANDLTYLDGGGAAGKAQEDIPRERLRMLERQLTDAEAESWAKQSVSDLAGNRGQNVPINAALQQLNTRLLDLRAEYARLRLTFAEEYPKVRQLKGQIGELEAQLARERERIKAELTTEYLVALRRQRLLQAGVTEQKDLLNRLDEKATRYRILERDVDAQHQLYANLQQKLQSAEISAAVAATDVNVLDRAAPPLVPVRPLPLRNLQLAAAFGLMIGLALAFVREYLDPTVRTVDDVDELEVPVLGVIPRATEALTAAGRPGEPALARPLAPARAPAVHILPRGRRNGRARGREASDRILADAFGRLRTAVLLDSWGVAARSLLITSAQPAEGKTTVSVNLALSLARLNRRVLLVDADARRPAVHRTFAIAERPGLLDYLAGDSPWQAFVRREVAPGVDVLPAGTPAATPAELLSSDRMRVLVEEAESGYDFVLLDSPALLVNAADTRIVAALADGVIVVVRTGYTPRPTVARVLRQLPNVAGVVLNDLEMRHVPAY